MAEYISKDQLHEITKPFKDSFLSFLTDEVDRLVDTIEPADVRPVEYGEWTAEGNDEYGNYWDECTVCRKAVFFPPSVKNDYKYCPHCGARMDGET